MEQVVAEQAVFGEGLYDTTIAMRELSRYIKAMISRSPYRKDLRPYGAARDHYQCGIGFVSSALV